MNFVSRQLWGSSGLGFCSLRICSQTIVSRSFASYASRAAPAAFKTSKSPQDGRDIVKPVTSRKTFLIDSYKQLMGSNPVILFVHYNNLMKNEDHHYRSQIKKAGGSLTVLRNNLFSVYLRNSAFPDPCAPIKRRDQNLSHPLLPLFKGPTAAICFPETDPQSVAKVLKLLEKSQDRLFVVGAKVETAVYDINQLSHFKNLPDKQGLQSQLLGLLHILSGAGLVKTLEAGSQTLYLTLQSHHDNNEKDGQE
ncbi:hypothetical protein ZYGR_0A04390 [Zygosaccharomyces rouxii]|uniref:ZYRO0A09944p n=2 Tax=Zygosaccharomyces rouxii TaxID=4956 RepID=C5DQA5_ZYGRC|nr:mitochondrial 54S ribosomal protein YmL11 [Zygosaccharomyces rouxii]KAH9198615.1 mitochondrial 54S ribosomal protein YmL11 [Zygosaccharomyces rouxii]GAV46841.1 hypothetical protein ZYGR_0A04390 [Zygosaccharomyces rouxii]CAR25866.1 ZYRO0A09944p [Zygosaccharomyces rouxii]